MRWGEVSRGPKGQGWGEKVFPIMRDGAGRGKDGDGARQNHAGGGGYEDPILRLRPTPPHCHP